MKILIVVTSGLGNIVLLSPFIKSLHQIYDKPEITLLTSSHRKEGQILKGWKYLKGCISNTENINHFDFDKILISPMYGSEFNPFLVSVPRDKIFRLDCNKPLNYQREHEVEVNMRYAYLEGFRGKIPDTHIETLKPNKMPKISRTKAVIGIHAGCLNHPDYKRKLWSTINWDKLCQMLIKGKCQVLIFGASKDYIPSNGIDLVNKYEDIRETAYVINKCDYFISNDSGLMHISNALNVPVISLFGPTHPSKNHPWNKGYRIIQSKKCKECYLDGRFFNCKDNKCMNEITPEMVYAELFEMTKKVKK